MPFPSFDGFKTHLLRKKLHSHWDEAFWVRFGAFGFGWRRHETLVLVFILLVCLAGMLSLTVMMSSCYKEEERKKRMKRSSSNRRRL
jgi:hypothetical protein